VKRRDFLKKAGVLAASVALSPLVLSNAQNSSRPRFSQSADGPFARRPTILQYREAGTTNPWLAASGIARLVPDTDRVVHTVELNSLTPDSQYEFRLPEGEVPAVYTTFAHDPTTSVVVHWQTYQPHPAAAYTGPFGSEQYKCRTFPAELAGSLRVAQISDTHGHANTNEKLIGDIAARGSRLIIHSGDLATGNGGDAGPGTWYTFFDALNAARDADGCIIPILPTLPRNQRWRRWSSMGWT